MLYKHGVFCMSNNLPLTQTIHFLNFAHHPAFRKTKTKHWMMDKIQNLKGAKCDYWCHNSTEMNVQPHLITCNTIAQNNILIYGNT